MPPYRNPVEARRKKERPVQKVADENLYMSSADFNEKYHNGHAPARPVRKRPTPATPPGTKRP
jgi:hypothetical protein